ncbi:MAG TPA: FKBP-type peptidyl-prolyl cis-trans isomerase [Caulobacteraceae bacterium]|jgi:peptidylprolyl isomerase/FKBP-type peptidyl-prolyl cis-trans isomerase FklB
MELRRLALPIFACAALVACQSTPSDNASSGPAPAAFMASNAQAPGVVSAGGIEYKVLQSGPADGQHPTPDDDVTVEYEGRLVNGKVFDATPPGQPVTFQLGSLIPGWITGLQLMRPGDEWMLWIPPDLGYGAEATGPIPANSVLAFKLKLVSVQPHKE